MRAHPMISATVATGLIEAVASAGHDPGELLQKFHLRQSTFLRPEGFIPCSDFARVLEEAASATADSYFGLHLGQRNDPKNIGPLVYAVLNAPTIGVACETAARYLHVHNEAVQIRIDEEPPLVYLRYLHVNLGLDQPRQFNEYSATGCLNVLRLMAGSQWSPREVQFAHRGPQDRTEHTRLFGAPVIFGCPTNAFVMDRQFFEREVPAADPRLFQIMRRYLDDVLTQTPREDGTLAAVRRAIAESMREGKPRLKKVAKQMAQSARTLQRSLESHGQDFKRMLDDTRRHFALEYLKDQANSLSEIAFLLGYSEVSAFNRAFKRWTGKTPLAYRRNFLP